LFKTSCCPCLRLAIASRFGLRTARPHLGPYRPENMVAGGLSVEVTEALGVFAQEVATSLATRSDLQEGSQPATLLAAALLAEGQARLAALDHTRCPSTASSAFRAAMQRAILGTSVASLQVGGGSRDAAPAVHVHVRGGIFTVGNAPECDIQIAGDASVLPCQLVVLALPGGAVVMDAWSANGTEVIARGRDGKEPVRVLGRVCSGAFVVEMSERLVLQVGDRSSISLETLEEVSALSDAGARPGMPTKSGVSAPTGLGLTCASLLSSAGGSCGRSSPSLSRSRSPRRDQVPRSSPLRRL